MSGKTNRTNLKLTTHNTADYSIWNYGRIESLLAAQGPGDDRLQGELAILGKYSKVSWEKEMERIRSVKGNYGRAKR
jgi:hypothetical protein